MFVKELDINSNVYFYLIYLRVQVFMHLTYIIL